MRDLENYFLKMCNDWLPGAMLPSEIWWLYKNALESEAEVLIECGRQNGYSTRLLAELLNPHGIKIYSIDFDEDTQRLAATVAMLSGLNVECVSGDIHMWVPKLLQQITGKRVAIVQDGPKGWEGMATLMASAIAYTPVLVAQHNLHPGHKSREAFQLLAVSPAFLEYDKASPEIHQFRAEEIRILATKTPNRAIDQTSLGLMVLDNHNIKMLRSNLRSLESSMLPWSPFRVAEHWSKGDFSFVSRLHAAQKYRLYRFKKR